MSDEHHYPLGPPINRTVAPALRPIAGRPNWFRDAKGVEHYVEPAGPPKTSLLGVSLGGPIAGHIAMRPFRFTLGRGGVSGPPWAELPPRGAH